MLIFLGIMALVLVTNYLAWREGRRSEYNDGYVLGSISGRRSGYDNGFAAGLDVAHGHEISTKKGAQNDSVY